MAELEKNSKCVPPFDGSRDHRDIRTFYTSEVDYLRAIQKRYACQWCGTSPGECPSCASLRERIEALTTAPAGSCAGASGSRGGAGTE
jgi:hypothetical protein